MKPSDNIPVLKKACAETLRWLHWQMLTALCGRLPIGVSSAAALYGQGDPCVITLVMAVATPLLTLYAEGMEIECYTTEGAHLNTNGSVIVENVKLHLSLIEISIRGTAPDLGAIRHAKVVQLYFGGVRLND